MILTTLKHMVLPRFTTKHVAFYRDPETNYLYPRLLATVVDPDEDGIPDAVIELSSISLLGWALFPSPVGEPMGWDEYLAEHKGE